VRNRHALIDEFLINGLLIAEALLLGLVLSESDGDIGDGSLELEGVEALLKRFPDVLEGLSADVVDLVKALHAILHDLSNRHNGVDILAHLAQGHLGGTALSELGQNILGVVAHWLSLSDPDFVGVSGSLLRTLDLSVSRRHFYLTSLYLSNIKYRKV
jgi:hypothetical protein